MMRHRHSEPTPWSIHLLLWQLRLLSLLLSHYHAHSQFQVQTTTRTLPKDVSRRMLKLSTPHTPCGTWHDDLRCSSTTYTPRQAPVDTTLLELCRST